MMPEATWRTSGDGGSIEVLEAKEWAQCIDQLKITLDIMYEICRIRQNVHGCEEALIYLKNAASDFTSLIDTIRIERDWEDAKNRSQAISWQIKGSLQRQTVQYQLKSTRGAKRRVHDSGQSVNLATNGINNDKGNKATNRTTASAAKKSATNCYANVTGGKIAAPRSAMDLPQTKASMAKMAYSRLLLWQQRKKQLVEKLIARRRQQQSQSLTAAGRRRSLPALSKNTSNIDEKISGQTRKQSQSGEKSGKMEMSNSQIVLSNLESINEAIVEDDNAEDNSSTHTMAGEFCDGARLTSRSEPPFNLDGWNIDVNEDEEWRAMTEEEKSLAQEEESLKKEIEEEQSVSVDDEMQRFVDDNAYKSNVPNQTDENCRPPGGWRPTWKEVVAKWKVKTDSFESDVDKPQKMKSQPELTQQNYRRPGELVQMRAKMLSPARRKPVDERLLDERQQKADELRQRLLNEKASRLRDLHQKIKEVNRKRDEIVQRKLEHLERVKKRMSRAEENRQRNILDIVKRAKMEEQRVMEVSFINTLDAENIRHEKQEVYERDADRLQRRVNELAEERARKFEQKTAKELAVEERRRLAEEKRIEQLRQNCDRHHERFQLAVAQRNELTEKLRSRIRDREQKIEDRRVNELNVSQNLLSRIQKKHERSSRRYEETLCQVRQKAGGMSSPRPPSVMATLADFSQTPADVEYAAKTGRLCVRCNVKISSDLQLMSHLLSDKHRRMASASHSHNQLDHDYFRKELEFWIREESREIDVTNNATEHKDANAKKRRAKIKTKINKMITAQLYNDDLSSISKQGAGNKDVRKIYRSISDLLSCLQSKNAEPFAIERAIFELTRNQTAASLAQKKQIAAHMQVVHLPEALLTYLTARIGSSSLSAAHSERLMTKSTALFDGAASISDTFSASLFTGSFLPSLCDLFSNLAELCDSLTDGAHYLRCCTLLLRTFCLIETHARQRAGDETIGKHAQLLFNYLGDHGFPEFLTSVRGRLRLKTTDTVTVPSAKLTKNSKKRSAKTKEATTMVAPMTLSNYGDTWTKLDGADGPENNVLNIICAVGSRLIPGDSGMKEINEGATQSYAELVGVFLNSLYAHFCVVAHSKTKSTGASTVRTADDATVMQNSFHSNGSSSTAASSVAAALQAVVEKYSPATVRCMAACLISLWNRAHSSAVCIQMTQAIFGKEEDECVALRLSFCLRFILQFSLRDSDADSRAIIDGAILAVGYFAAISEKCQQMCLLGWHRSLTAQLCSVMPSEYFMHAKLRHRLLPTLICLLHKHSAALDIVRGSFYASLILAYLKECDDEYNTSSALPPLLLRLNLEEVKEFFEAYGAPTQAIT